MNSSQPPAPDTPEPRFPDLGPLPSDEVIRAALERLRLDERLPKHNHPVPPPCPVMHIYCPVCTRTFC